MCHILFTIFKFYFKIYLLYLLFLGIKDYACRAKKSNVPTTIERATIYTKTVFWVVCLSFFIGLMVSMKKETIGDDEYYSKINWRSLWNVGLTVFIASVCVIPLGVESGIEKNKSELHTL